MDFTILLFIGIGPKCHTDFATRSIVFPAGEEYHVTEGSAGMPLEALRKGQVHGSMDNTRVGTSVLLLWTLP